MAGTSRPLPAILVGGLIVGVLDLLYAIGAYSPQKPIRVLQTIASGVLGVKSFTGGAKTATLGVVMNFIVAFGAVASRRLGILVEHAFLFGPFYGGLVYLFGEGKLSAFVAHHAAGSFPSRRAMSSLVISFSSVRRPQLN